MPGRSCGSKTLPRSRHRATGTPSGPDQRGERHGSRIHTAHRNGVNPTAARYQAGRRRGRLRATCPQGYAIPDGSAGVPRDDTFCHRARSSSRSKPLGETGMGYCKRSYRLTSYTGQLWVDKPDGWFRGQAPKLVDINFYLFILFQKQWYSPFRNVAGYLLEIGANTAKIHKQKTASSSIL